MSFRVPEGCIAPNSGLRSGNLNDTAEQYFGPG